jgi:hypothetical protein
VLWSRVRSAALAACAALIAIAPAHAQSPGDRALADFAALFEGRFDNDLQVFFAADTGAADAATPRTHMAIRKVDVAALGASVYLVERTQGGATAQSLYAFAAEASGALRSQRFEPTEASRAAFENALRDPARLAALTAQSLSHTAPCDMAWTREAGQFVGVVGDACRTRSASGAPALLARRVSVSADAIWIDERIAPLTRRANDAPTSTQFRLRRARPFSCWVSVLRGANHGDAGAGASAQDWYFTRDVRLHDQGGDAVITTDEQPPRRLFLRLRRVEWATGTNRPSLTLYVHEGESQRATSYVWGDYDADRLGINLRWMQASCTQDAAASW